MTGNNTNEKHQCIDLDSTGVLVLEVEPEKATWSGNDSKVGKDRLIPIIE